jgi:hypothetical protein
MMGWDQGGRLVMVYHTVAAPAAAEIRTLPTVGQGRESGRDVLQLLLDAHLALANGFREDYSPGGDRYQ